MSHEIYAIRYAQRAAKRSDHFIGGDPHDGPMPMDYFAWVIRGDGRIIVVDTGFTAEVAKKRGRDHLRCPVESLSLLGIDPAAVTDVVLTHLHYDHVGNFDRFPKADFHLREAELHYACGHYMRHKQLRHSFEVEDVTGIIRMNYAGRVVFHEGVVEPWPGIRLHPTGGHSAGLQFVSVATARGTVVLASDVTHFYENMESGRPFTTAFHVGEMLEGFDRLRAVATSPAHIIPGHDPLVMQRYPAPSPALDGIVVRLDVAPRA
ncbi:MAG TPA: N-acyl homoserine lactonase family protein [Roseomonas sp.]|jgi:glyoxylase-like metal-dependent hydrolase (beta-lactamase superfamily II)